jgi:hypothetical protein
MQARAVHWARMSAISAPLGESDTAPAPQATSQLPPVRTLWQPPSPYASRAG